MSAIDFINQKYDIIVIRDREGGTSMKLEIGDKVRTCFGNGEIVFVNEERLTLHYLVKIKGVDGHGGNGVHGYDNKDGLNVKRWFLEKHLELLEKGETNV